MFLIPSMLVAYNQGFLHPQSSFWARGLFVVAGVLLVASGTRISVLAVAAVIGLTLLRRGRLLTLVGVGSIGIAVLAALPAALNRFAVVDLSSFWYGGDLFTFTQQGTFEGRLVPWSFTWEYFVRAAPILGNGAGATNAIFDRALVNTGAGAVHNEFLRVVAEGGAVGVLLFIAAYLVPAWRGMRLSGHSDPRVRTAALLLLTMPIAYLVVSATDNPFLAYYQFGGFIWFAIAVADGVLSSSVRADANAERAPTPAARPPRAVLGPVRHGA